MNGAFLEPSGMREYMKKKTTETSSRYGERESVQTQGWRRYQISNRRHGYSLVMLQVIFADHFKRKSKLTLTV